MDSVRVTTTIIIITITISVSIYAETAKSLEFSILSSLVVAPLVVVGGDGGFYITTKSFY